MEEIELYAVNCVRLFKGFKDEEFYHEMPVTLYFNIADDGTIKVIKKEENAKSI